MNREQVKLLSDLTFKSGYFTVDGKFFDDSDEAGKWTDVLIVAEVIKKLWQGRWGFNDVAALQMAQELSENFRMSVITMEDPEESPSWPLAGTFSEPVEVPQAPIYGEPVKAAPKALVKDPDDDIPF